VARTPLLQRQAPAALEGEPDRPGRPNHPDALIDACIAFYPQHFRSCPSLAEAALVLNDTDCLDFDLGTTNVPVIWKQLREEARPLFKQLCVMQARLERVD